MMISILLAVAMMQQPQLTLEDSKHNVMIGNTFVPQAVGISFDPPPDLMIHHSDMRFYRQMRECGDRVWAAEKRPCRIIFEPETYMLVRRIDIPSHVNVNFNHAELIPCSSKLHAGIVWLGRDVVGSYLHDANFIATEKCGDY